MAFIPPSGTPGRFDGRNPTLIPNFDKPVASGGNTLDHQSPADFILANPRVDATVTATIGGSATPADVVTLKVTSGAISGGSLSVAYTVGGADALNDIAAGLAKLVNNSAPAQAVNLRASVVGAVVTLAWNGPVGNTGVLTSTLSGGASETVTLGAAGVFAGGSGPVFAANNFTYTWNAATQAYFYGQPYILGSDVIKAMVAQSMPIV